MSNSLLHDALKLSPTERLSLIGELWDSVVAEAPDSIALTDAQAAELERRLDHIEKHGATGDPWPVVRQRIINGSTGS